jgi:hypothetical protein
LVCSGFLSFVIGAGCRIGQEYLYLQLDKIDQENQAAAGVALLDITLLGFLCCQLSLLASPSRDERVPE